jgi:hypothetical protein
MGTGENTSPANAGLQGTNSITLSIDLLLGLEAAQP